MSTSINVQVIPQELKEFEQWVNWKTEMRGDKETKIPCEPNGMHARTNAQWTWSPFEICMHALTNFNRDNQLKGIGFVLHTGYTGTDVDDCVDPETGEITDPDVERKIHLLNSYTEYSPSRRGLHVINRASKPGARCKTGNFEMYDSDRFFTVTGDHFPGSPTTIEGNQDAVNAVYHEIFGDDNNDHRDNEPTSPIRDNAFASENGARLKDSEVIRKAAAAKNGDKFMRLFHDGDTSGYPSKSEADLALCGMLGFWCGNDPEQIDLIVRRSALFREKWDERRGDDTYGNITLRNALAEGGETYGSTSEVKAESLRGQNSTTAGALTEVRADHGQKDGYETEHPYIVESGRLICIARKFKDGGKEIIPTTLTNFNAWITRSITVDDGIDPRRYFDLVGVRDDGTPLREIRVPAKDFPTMGWLAEWDGLAVCRAGYQNKDHTRAAIQFLSLKRGYPTLSVFGHIGWERVSNEWIYLHAGGAIGADGLKTDVDVLLEDERLMLFDLPGPGSIENILKAISQLLDKGPKRLTYLDVAKVFRAPLNEITPILTSFLLVGPTGSKKSSYNALWQAFWGPGFNKDTLPANWLSTGNRNEMGLHLAKDAVCEIDDYKPVGDAKNISKYRNDAERIFRGQANNQGRARLKQNLGLAKTFHSRSFVSVSGEDMPTGESLLARILTRELHHGDLDLTWLSEAQEQAAAGVYASVMSAYLQWLAPQIDTLKDSRELEKLREAKRDYYRTQLSGAHDRVYEALPDVFLGFEMFLRFAVDLGVVTDSQAKEYKRTVEDELLALGTVQAKYISGEDPAHLFLEAVAAVLVSGRGHLRDAETNETPETVYDATTLGWDFVYEKWNAKGRCIGWIDKALIYLEPSAAFAEAQKLMSEQGASIPFQKSRLYKLMSDKGLAATDSDGSGRGKQKKIKGRNKRVVCVDTFRVLGSQRGGEDE